MPSWPRTTPSVVIDANAVVSAALKADPTPERALRLARRFCTVCMSRDVSDEIGRVLARPWLRARIPDERRDEMLDLLHGAARTFEPAERAMDCRDAKDDRYLELALAACADIIVSGDQDLLVLDSWRGVRIPSPAAFVALWDASPP